MHLFFDTVWKLHIGEIPEKPDPKNYLYPGLLVSDLKQYEQAIAAIKNNALTIANPEIIPVFPKPHIKGIIIPKNFKPGEFYFWPGGYETKEIDTVEDGGGCYIAGSQTVAILTLPEEKNIFEENEQLRESIKELLAIAEDRLFSVPVTSLDGVQAIIERARKTLNKEF